jgi:ABC-type multidrug transport system ATPase subunit
MNTLSIRNISKTYRNSKVKSLDNVSLELSAGVYGVMGPNGAGKSTLMNIIADNILPDDGTVRFGNLLSSSDEFRALLGYMPQQQGIYEEFTAVRFLWYFSALKGIPKREARVKIEYLLKLVNLQDDAYKKLGAYSGGMKQRVLLAQALLNDPRILMLDEPTAGLDPKERVRTRNFIAETAKDKIVLLATHIVSDVEKIAKEIIFIKHGKIIERGSLPELLASYSGKADTLEDIYLYLYQEAGDDL